MFSVQKPPRAPRPDHAQYIASWRTQGRQADLGPRYAHPDYCGRYGRAGITQHDAAYYKRLADKARHWLPELVGKKPVFTWAVDLEVASDMIPALHVLGSKAPGVAIEGLGALGVLPGIVLGRQAGGSVVSRLR